MRCRTYFTGLGCPRCDYKLAMRIAPWQRRYQPERPGRPSKLGDSEVRIIQPPYRPTDPCE